MKIWFGAAAMLFVVYPAFAADVATCALGADKKTVMVTASNPYTEVMACEVNCHMDIPNGFATVVCVKPVPVGSKDFVMCTDVSKDSYTRVKETSVNCPDPAAPPAAVKADTKAKDDSADDDDDDDDDAKADAKADAKMKKMLKRGQDFLDRQKQK
jgi:hypothetical protein